MIPDEERQQSLKDNFESLRNRLLAEDGFFDGLTKNASETMSQFREMLKERRERATSAGGGKFACYFFFFTFCTLLHFYYSVVTHTEFSP